MQFATVEDFKLRFTNTVADARLNILLQDASNLITSLYTQCYGLEYERGAHLDFEDNVCAVTCNVVSRALATPTELYGVSQFSESVGEFSNSATFSNATGDMFLTKSEKARLGLNKGRIKSVSMKGGTDVV